MSVKPAAIAGVHHMDLWIWTKTLWMKYKRNMRMLFHHDGWRRLRQPPKILVTVLIGTPTVR
ncbi:MAG: hypothetical protein OXC91_06460, partial [Rhodobacteraceae bacterium]|nr:hypothetical protein [Paracoccaceae bacterium]